MKHLFLILILCTIQTHIFYGQKNFDNITDEVSTMPDDTSKVNRLLLLGEHYCSRDNDKALMFLQEAYTISMNIDYPQGIGKSLMWQGRVYYYKSNFDLSNKYLDKAKKILETTDDINALSFWYMAKGADMTVGGDYVRGIEVFKKSIELSKKIGNKKRESTGYYSIGEILRDRGDVNKAMKYYEEALSIKKEISDTMGIANVFSCLAYSFSSLGMLDSSLYYHKQALKIRTELKIDRHIASSEMNIGEILIKMGRYDEAIKILKQARPIFESLNEMTGLIMVNLKLAEAMNCLANPKALELANRTLQMTKDINNQYLLSVSYHKLSDIYAFRNDYKKAFEYQNKYRQIADSLFNSEKDRMLEELEIKFQTEKKDNKIHYLTIKNQTQRKNNILLAILIFFFAVGLILLFFLLKAKSTAFKRQQQLREQEHIIHLQENKLAKQEKRLLSEQLESKNRELASKALEMIRMNETISDIIEKMEELNSLAHEDTKILSSVKEIIHDLETNTKQNIWKEFDKIFKNIHSDFYARLLETSPDLTSTEIKTAALLKLNLSTKEIAAITFKSEGGIKTTRYRLRKKLGLSGDDKLVAFLMQI